VNPAYISLLYRNADSATLQEDGSGSILFVKPHEEQQDFAEFLDYVTEQEKSGSMDGEVRYAQTRDPPPFLLCCVPCLPLVLFERNRASIG
jgi:hypothetical protein